jgi:CBS domain-containing protein
METTLIVPSHVRSAATLETRSPVLESELHLDSEVSALCAMTDFRQEYPITVEANVSIDEALADMNRLQVHALIVVPQDSDSLDIRLLGLITAYDISRERPHRSISRQVTEIRRYRAVGEVMTTWNELTLIKYASLQALTAKGVYELFKGTGLTHLLVVEDHGDESAVAIGLLSRSTLAKRLQGAGNMRRS